MSTIVPPASDMQADEPLFAGYEPPEPAADDTAGLSADQRRTRRQAANVAAGIHPLTGGRLHPLASRHRDADSPKDDPFTCGSCWFRDVAKYHDRSYAKCWFGVTNEDRRAPRVTNGAASDVRAWWPACPDYSPGASASPDAARHIPETSGCQHEWLDRPESDTRECLICGTEAAG